MNNEDLQAQILVLMASNKDLYKKIEDQEKKIEELKNKRNQDASLLYETRSRFGLHPKLDKLNHKGLLQDFNKLEIEFKAFKELFKITNIGKLLAGLVSLLLAVFWLFNALMRISSYYG
jgi:septal ring factor EnvC (AmiA/AmiB activator)